MAAGQASALPGPPAALFADSAAAGCVAAAAQTDCGATAPLAGASDLVVAPDGRHAYAAASGTSSIVPLSVDGFGAPTGVGAGCLSSAAVAGCAAAIGLNGVAALALSADGESLYAASPASSAVAVFAREAGSGALSQPAAACVADQIVGPLGPVASTAGCVPAQGLAGASDVALSPDGSHVYVAAAAADAVALLARDPASGALEQPIGPSACVSTAPPGAAGPLTDPQCGSAAPLAGASAVAVSADGRHVYVAAPGSRTVSAFAREPASGALSLVGCVSLDVGTGGAPAPSFPGCTAAAGLSDPTALARLRSPLEKEGQCQLKYS